MNKLHGIIVFGTNGSGKTTLGRELARILNFKHMDMRDGERIKRGIENTFHFYNEYDYLKIDTTALTVAQTAEKVITLFTERGTTGDIKADVKFLPYLNNKAKISVPSSSANIKSYRTRRF